jgi:predicted transporter
VPFILSSGLTHYPATIQAFMKSGIITPLVLAGLMIAWTLLLLKKRPVHVIKNYGWLFLMFPCPVCAAVVLFSTAFFISIYPNQLVLIITRIYLIFLLVGFTTMIICRRFQPKEAGFPDTFLGGLMLLTGIYFLLSAIIVPQFTDLTGVYRMAGYHTGTISRGTSAVLWPMLVVTTAFVLGCFFTFKKIRSLK